MKNRIFEGEFYNDFSAYEISKSGKTIKVWDKVCPIPTTFKIKDAGTEFARFQVSGFSGDKVVYYLNKFIKENK